MLKSVDEDIPLGSTSFELTSCRCYVEKTCFSFFHIVCNLVNVYICMYDSANEFTYIYSMKYLAHGKCYSDYTSY